MAHRKHQSLCFLQITIKHKEFFKLIEESVCYHGHQFSFFCQSESLNKCSWSLNIHVDCEIIQCLYLQVLICDPLVRGYWWPGVFSRRCDFLLKFFWPQRCNWLINRAGEKHLICATAGCAYWEAINGAISSSAITLQTASKHRSRASLVLVDNRCESLNWHLAPSRKQENHILANHFCLSFSCFLYFTIVLCRWCRHLITQPVRDAALALSLS